MSLLHDLNRAFFCDPDGNYSASKIFASTAQGLFLNAFWHHDDKILANWDIFAMFVVAFLAPDILKKFITMKLGGGLAEGATRTVTSSESSKSTTTKSEGERVR